jgi:alkylated DNA repair protein alkB family protein 7
MKRRRYERGHWDAVITGYKEVELSDISFLPLATSDERRDDKHDYDDDYCDENNPQTIIPAIFEQIRQHLAERHLNHNHNKSSIRWLPCHAIDLKKDGELKAHVDSVRFSGDLVAGLSLKSPSIMRLKIPPKGYNNDTDDEERESGQRDDSSNVGGCNDDDGYIDLFLPPRSLYALTGIGRYCYSHELLPDQSTFVEPATGIETLVRRDHRISIIFRDAKHE